MTEWEKQKLRGMSDEELSAEAKNWNPDSKQGVFIQTELAARRHAAVRDAIKQAAKPHGIFKWTLVFTVIGAIAAAIAALDAILRWLHVR